MDLGIRTESKTEDNRSWLGSAHGAHQGDTVTLKGSAFTGTWADGNVPSGVALGKITATGLYAPYTNAETHGVGTGVMRGVLLTATSVKDSSAATKDVGAALLWHGDVIEANLPASHGVDANGKADVPTIRFS